MYYRLADLATALQDIFTIAIYFGVATQVAS
jgi:hypothetical protein